MTTSGIELKAHSHSEDQLSPSTGLKSSTNDSIVLLKSHGESVRDDKKQVLIKLRNVVILALIFMTLEIIGGLLADSIAILSDAAHMLSDLLSFAISIISVYISTFPPNSRNSFGYHRAGVVGALASVVLIWVLTAFLVYYAIDRIFNLHTVDLDAGIMLGTSIIGLGMNLVMVKVLHGSGHGHDCGHSHGHSHGHAHAHAHSHSHSHLEGTECSHDHSEHHHHASETPQDYSPPVHGEGSGHSGHTHNHGSHKHSQFSNYRKDPAPHSHQHGAGCDHKHSKKPPSIRISPNKRYGRGEFDSPVQRLIASSPADPQNKSSPPNDKANLSTEKTTETSLTDQGLAGSNSQRDNVDGGHTHTHQHHDHDHHDHHDHKEHHHHDHDHGHSHTHSHSDSHTKSKSKSHSHSHHDHDHGHNHHHHEEDLNIRAAMIHIIGDILQSIGVIIASVVIMFNPEKFKIIDPILTIIFSIIVLFTTKRILGDCLNVIMQSTPVHIDADEIKRLIEVVPNVKSVHNLHIWSLTTGKPVLSAHVFADGDLSEVLAKVTKVCRKEGIKHSTIQIEYIHDEEHQNFINCDHEIC